ncbi:MAG: DUF4126 domain-containing protein [Deltaproteobacteria bacterium]|nr:DUF4126 domain-containing protein [Deltaproteobacteria bacterium]
MGTTPPELMPLVSVALGLGLAAAAGFRVFVPLLVLGGAARAGYVGLADGFEWLATTPALVALGTATLVEVAAYHVPYVDHLLDVLATPSAVLAGVIASAAVLTDMPPVVKWTVAVIAGGGAAGLVQSATVAARIGSTAFTGGLGNILFASLEMFGAAGTALLAIALPLLGLILVLILLLAAALLLARVVRRRPSDAR